MSTVRDELGSNVSKFSRLLLDQPDPTAATFMRDYENYVESLYEVGMQTHRGSLVAELFGIRRGRRGHVPARPWYIPASPSLIVEALQVLDHAKQLGLELERPMSSREGEPRRDDRERVEAYMDARVDYYRIPDELEKNLRTSREIRVVGRNVDGSEVASYRMGEIYSLGFSVGRPIADNLATGDLSVKDVPPGGLQTRWMITSTTVEFVGGTRSPSIMKVGNAWTAIFDLVIPEDGNSEARRFWGRITGEKPQLHLSIYAMALDGRCELYRESVILLQDRPIVDSDVTAKAVLHTHLNTTHEWTTPPEHIEVLINNGTAIVTTKRIHLVDHAFQEPFTATDTRISGPIDNVRKALEKFRVAHEAYLNDLDQADMEARLLQPNDWQPHYFRVNGWQPLPGQPALRQHEAFAVVARSAEWKALCMAGYTLFDQTFDQQSKLRSLLTTLLPGSRVDFHWTSQSGAGWVAQVPWALMHLNPVDVTGTRYSEAEDFLGLRFRIGSRSWPVANGSVVLGGIQESHTLNLLYWGDKADDEVAVESRWQETEFAKVPRSHFLPRREQPDFKGQLVKGLDEPAPPPVGIVYLFCHCKVGNGAEPLLKFGDSPNGADSLGIADLSLKALKDGPLVFANACTTLQADPHMASLLQAMFFSRGVRAFLGSETKVPIQLASKVAWLYFRFLNRIVDNSPMTAGEALTQARMFLWTQYRNVGGLFYSLTNQYDLYLASEDEVRSLRRQG